MIQRSIFPQQGELFPFGWFLRIEGEVRGQSDLAFLPLSSLVV